MPWPDWWLWELQLSNHAATRLAERGIDEPELRRLLGAPVDLASGTRSGRVVIETERLGHIWHVVAEPDEHRRVLLVVTAFPGGVR